jgi:hypothetical protein
MPRFILIDEHSGFIYGDTADLPRDHLIEGEQAGDLELTPELAARWVDEAEGGKYGRRYSLTSHMPQGASGYHVYRADVGGSDAVPLVWDGQDRETIEAVLEYCKYYGFVSIEGKVD